MNVDSVLIAVWIVTGAAGFAAGMIGLAATKRRLMHADSVDLLVPDQEPITVG